MKNINPLFYKTFRAGSTTYFYSSLFFSNAVKRDVFILYSFVRKADNFIDILPQQKDSFYKFKKNYELALQGKVVEDLVINEFCQLVHRRNINREWVEAFLLSMEMDLHKNTYKDMGDLQNYMYGSAEVIGLMMAKILNLPEQSYEAAQYLGRSMQYINFIRDIDEDLKLGRVYMPQSDLQSFELLSLEPQYIKNNQQKFNHFIQAQVELYLSWKEHAEKGFRYINTKDLIPIKTASDMYAYTAMVIKKDPMVVYKTKVKPNSMQVISKIFKNSLESVSTLHHKS